MPQRLVFESFFVSGKLSSQLYICSLPRCWGTDDVPQGHLTAGLCVALPLLSRAAELHLFVIIQEKLVDIFTLISYLQSKHISPFTTEHFHQEAWNCLEADPEHSLSFTGKPSHSVDWNQSGELLKPWPQLVLMVPDMYSCGRKTFWNFQIFCKLPPQEVKFQSLLCSPHNNQLSVSFSFYCIDRLTLREKLTQFLGKFLRKYFT